jgi:hypothetical protein
MFIIKKVTVVFVISVFLSACSADSDSDRIVVDTNADKLEGTWVMNETTQEGTFTTDVQGVPFKVNFTSYGENIAAQVVFTNTPNSIVSSGGFDNVVTISGLAITETIPVQLNDFLTNGTWTVDGGVITISQNNQQVEAFVIELTDTLLKIEVDIIETLTLQGVTGDVESTASITFAKQ